MMRAKQQISPAPAPARLFIYPFIYSLLYLLVVLKEALGTLYMLEKPHH